MQRSAQRRLLDATRDAMRMAQSEPVMLGWTVSMRQGERLRHWQQLAEGYVESAATLYRKQKYPHMLHHCYFAVQSALEATFIARRAYRVPTTISLVAMAAALGDGWSVAHRELFLELTEWYRGHAESLAFADRTKLSKEECLRTLMATSELVREVLDAEK